jgi:hypothetical protein
MLPHGYEGQGPEHSSARIERFMQLAADTNMQIVQPTTASQIFHVLRRQMVRNLRKPLIIFTPKSLLRNKDATSPLSEFTKGSFQTVIPDSHELKAERVKRMVVCSGKVYYDLVKQRKEKGLEDVAIVRVEQLYPFPHKAFAQELKKYPNLSEIVWTQDEPQNQGAWFFLQHYIHENMLEGQKLAYSGRAASASPAAGYSHLHQEQQKALVEGAFTGQEAAKWQGFKNLMQYASKFQQLIPGQKLGILPSEVAAKLFTTPTGESFLLGMGSLNPTSKAFSTAVATTLPRLLSGTVADQTRTTVTAPVTGAYNGIMSRFQDPTVLGVPHP